MLVVNLYGASGAGKSAITSGLFGDISGCITTTR